MQRSDSLALPYFSESSWCVPEASVAHYATAITALLVMFLHDSVRSYEAVQSGGGNYNATALDSSNDFTLQQI
jgi:hypothetical protein